MNLEKVCEYLNDIGILEYDNVNKFLEIYSKLNSEEYHSNFDKIKQTLCIYIKNLFLKNDKLLILCDNIIKAFSNYQLILKYRALNSLRNILNTKIHLKYIKFIKDISFYLLYKNKILLKKTSTQNTDKKANNLQNSNLRKLYNEIDNSIELNKNNVQTKLEDLLSSSDERECTFKPKINKNFKGYNNKINNIGAIQSYIYCSPSINIPPMLPINFYANNFINSNTIQKIVNEINNENNNNYSSQVLTNNNISPDKQKNLVIKNNKLFNKQINNLRLINRMSEGTALDIENNNINNNFMYNSTNLNNQKNINSNNVLTNVVNNHFSTSNIDDLYNKELEHLQKINNNLKQKITSNYKYIREASIQPSLPKKNNDCFFIENPFQNFGNKKVKNISVCRTSSVKNKPNKVIKVHEDLSLVRQRRTEKTKQLMKKYNFTPKTKNDKMTDLKKKIQKSKFNKMKNLIEDNLHSAGKSDKNNISDVINTFGKEYFNIKEEKLISSPVNSKENINMNNVKEIENNKLSMMDKILKEHKIGFKPKTESGINELQNSERLKNNNKNIVENDGKNIKNIERNNDIIKEDIICDNEIPTDDFSFKNCNFQSNALKTLLNTK